MVNTEHAFVYTLGDN